jgi:hypothetical protein
MDQGQMQMPNIDLSKTTSIETSSGNKIWQQGFILRKVSKFITGTTEDGIMPIPVFFDPETGKVLTNTLPPELRKEFEGDNEE